jgi:hypothetical protein
VRAGRWREGKVESGEKRGDGDGVGGGYKWCYEGDECSYEVDVEETGLGLAGTRGNSRCERYLRDLFVRFVRFVRFVMVTYYGLGRGLALHLLGERGETIGEDWGYWDR